MTLTAVPLPAVHLFMAPHFSQFRPHGSLVRLIQRAGVWLWHQEGSPGQRARGLAAGVFCGCFPFFGVQTLLGIALASVMRGNHLLAAAGTWISNPFTYVPLYWINYRIGSLLLGPGKGWPGLEVMRSEAIWQLGWSFVNRMLLGSLLMGLVAATLCGWTYWRWLQRHGNAPANLNDLTSS
ncbi:hypothetical protein IFHNHDMJ_00460 [Synechococcus sp. CBW1107]|nr:hypothetical protein IFHNHDMJ_00460 [Synechococcus sp. CBW1107]